MRRNCNLELQLHHRSDEETQQRHQEQQQETQQQQQQLMTIFYNGMMCARDVTELQARTIIFLANKDMEERVKTPLGLSTPSGSEPSSPSVMSPLCSPVAGLSMKRSLQRFLQKRKYRLEATSPYNH